MYATNKNKRIDFSKIKGLHLEITTKCNAMCHMCGRNYKGKVRKKLNITELSLENCQKIFDKNFIQQLERISICGVYGDPINAKELVEIIEYFYLCNNDILINLYTNGSKHSVIWWKKLAKILKNGYVIFGIDGIGDIHSIHRKGTSYIKIIQNAKAFIEAGGKAKWDYIVFKHNEHQILFAEELSKNLGFSSFQVKKTSRFFKNLYEKDPKLDSTILSYGKFPIYSKENSIDYLELPNNAIYKNKEEDTLFNLIKEYGTLENYFNSTHIKCGSIKNKGIFVSAMGEVYPCCSIYQQICYGLIYDVSDNNELNEYNLYKNNNLSAFKHSIQEIIEGNFFKQLEKSWYFKKISEGKPKCCSRKCGEKLDTHKAQHSI